MYGGDRCTTVYMYMCDGERYVICMVGRGMYGGKRHICMVWRGILYIWWGEVYRMYDGERYIVCMMARVISYV